MKKLFAKDKLNRLTIKKLELKQFIIKHIVTNSNYFLPLQWKAMCKLINTKKRYSISHLSNRCIKTFNKKTFHKFSRFSRIVFLKLAKSGLISNLRRSSW
jgi:ribosomal protein S14